MKRLYDPSGAYFAVEKKMEKTVAEMTTGDNSDLLDSLWDRLLHQKKQVAAGERGEELDDVVRRLGLA